LIHHHLDNNNAYTDDLLALSITHTITHSLSTGIGAWKKSWRALEMLYKVKKVRAIGVSNFNVQQLKTLMVRKHALIPMTLKERERERERERENDSSFPSSHDAPHLKHS
jgi:diketogulonate reductase-like aldo/keto reductase